jgi:hypothetical protein
MSSKLERSKNGRKAGTDVMISKNIFAEKFAKLLPLFAQTTASFHENLIIQFAFDKSDNFFRRKLAKIVENCDHNIQPRLATM